MNRNPANQKDQDFVDALRAVLDMPPLYKATYRAPEKHEVRCDTERLLRSMDKNWIVL